jgi:predicted N-acetyltransferase YhbS
MIRRARAEDLPTLREIERAAGEAFRTVGMDVVADFPLPTIEELQRYQRDGRAWVATDDRDQPVGYLLADVIDGHAHVAQVSVHPDHAGQRIGAALIEHVATRARADGHAALTLTTFADVPWNAPYYRRLGFRTLFDDEITPELRAIRERETALGLDHWPRACMRRDL